MLYSSIGSQSLVLGPAASASPGNVLETQMLSPAPDVSVRHVGMGFPALGALISLEVILVLSQVGDPVAHGKQWGEEKGGGEGCMAVLLPRPSLRTGWVPA